MNVLLIVPALVSLFIGVMVLVFPKLLRILIGLYFLFIGIIGLVVAFA